MSKSLTASRGPIAATEIDVQKAKAINALLTRPAAILPVSAGDRIYPFAVGLFEDFRLRLKADYTPTRLRRAIAAFVHTRRYYLASAQPDAMRHDIEGLPVEAVSPEDRAIAQNRFKALKSNGDKIASATEPAPEPPIPVESQPSKTELIRAALLKRRVAPPKPL